MNNSNYYLLNTKPYTVPNFLYNLTWSSKHNNIQPMTLLILQSCKLGFKLFDTKAWTLNTILPPKGLTWNFKMKYKNPAFLQMVMFVFKWLSKNSTYQSTKSSIKYTKPSLIIREIYKAFNISIVIGTEDSVSCRVNLIKASRSYFQNDRFSGITPVMLIAVISLEKKNINFRFIYTHAIMLHLMYQSLLKQRKI